MSSAMAAVTRAELGEIAALSDAATTGPTMKATSSAVASRLSALARWSPADVMLVQAARIAAPSGAAAKPPTALSPMKTAAGVVRASVAIDSAR